MNIKKIEELVFIKKTKDQLIEETLISLSGLLADIFTGDDVNELKKEFPENTQIENIGIELKAVNIYLHNKELEYPCLEITIDMIHEVERVEFGTYSLIFDLECEQIDEIINLY